MYYSQIRFYFLFYKIYLIFIKEKRNSSLIKIRDAISFVKCKKGV